jgi:hypothetical protein
MKLDPPGIVVNAILKNIEKLEACITEDRVNTCKAIVAELRRVAETYESNVPEGNKPDAAELTERRRFYYADAARHIEQLYCIPVVITRRLP